MLTVSCNNSRTESTASPPEQPQAPTIEPNSPSTSEPEAAEGEEVEVKVKSPFSVPTGEADSYNEEIKTQEEYEVITRKINLRTAFITAKIPNVIADMVCNKMYGYWTGGKLAKVNPHYKWSEKDFMPGTTHLKNKKQA